ncbi:hypothetical protein NC653_017581 [Populus alba x Populus x berolinensis]|uniref:Uncharacterized protein n=1 Tax=Populus alba x Populus x berolinensis TaxID=444605 RepID=A0AAD6W0S6_9ROSI|nr:hypothetical protein NC653_017581 [Populus alba x Populus x berolinensis]
MTWLRVVSCLTVSYFLAMKDHHILERLAIIIYNLILKILQIKFTKRISRRTRNLLQKKLSWKLQRGLDKVFVHIINLILRHRSLGLIIISFSLAQMTLFPSWLPSDDAVPELQYRTKPGCPSSPSTW